MTEYTARPVPPAASNAAKVGIGFGSALAITISWSVNKSIIWTMIDGSGQRDLVFPSRVH